MVAPILASLATQCDESPRGTAPSLIASIELRLESVPADEPTDEDEARMYGFCLQRMSYANHVRPSWRAREEITLREIAPTVFVASFNDVPVNFSNNIIVHDENECRREPRGSGRVVTGGVHQRPAGHAAGGGPASSASSSAPTAASARESAPCHGGCSHPAPAPEWAS